MGIGFIALGMSLTFTKLIIGNGAALFPLYVCYIIILLGVLIVKRKINQKYLNYAIVPLCLIIIWQFISIPITYQYIDLIVDSILTISIWYLLLHGIYTIDFEYPNKQRYKKRITIWLTILILFRIPVINAITVLLSLGIVNLIFFIYTLLLVNNLAYINRILEVEYEDILPIRKIPRKSSYKILAIIGLVISCIGILVFEKQYTYFMEEVPYHSNNESFFLQNDKVIIDNLAIQATTISNYSWETRIIDPTIYLEDSLLEQAATIDIEFFEGNSQIAPSGRYQGECIKMNQDNYYPGYSPLLIDYTEYLSFNSINYSNDFKHPLEANIRLKIYNQNNHVIYELKDTSLKPVNGRLYSYEDNEISIVGLEIYKNQMIEAPSIHLKSINTDCIYLSLIGEDKSNLLTYDFKGQENNYIYNRITNTYFHHDSIQIKLMFDNGETKIYTLRASS